MAINTTPTQAMKDAIAAVFDTYFSSATMPSEPSESYVKANMAETVAEAIHQSLEEVVAEFGNTAPVSDQGTWTPEFRDSAGNILPSGSHNYQAGYYVRVGNLIHVNFRIGITGSYTPLVATNVLRVHGLPFNCQTQPNSHATLSFSFASGAVKPTADSSWNAYIAPASKVIYMQTWDVATGTSALQVQELSDNLNPCNIIGGGTYITDDP